MVEWALGRALPLLIGAGCTLGCATQRELVDRSASAGPSRYSFWPPPPSTSLGSSELGNAAQPATLHGFALRIGVQLRAAGYPEPRWYPIGLGYLHGFAATTRLEALNDDASPKPEPGRWSGLYPDAAELRWLTLARSVPLPHPGRYRVFLIAVTDLALDSNRIAPVWSEDTVMDGPGVNPARGPLDALQHLESKDGELEKRQDLSRYRLGVYVYQYERPSDQARGRLSARAAGWSTAEQIRAAGLSLLSERPLLDGR